MIATNVDTSNQHISIIMQISTTCTLGKLPNIKYIPNIVKMYVAHQNEISNFKMTCDRTQESKWRNHTKSNSTYSKAKIRKNGKRARKKKSYFRRGRWLLRLARKLRLRRFLRCCFFASWHNNCIGWILIRECYTIEAPFTIKIFWVQYLCCYCHIWIVKSTVPEKKSGQKISIVKDQYVYWPSGLNIYTSFTIDIFEHNISFVYCEMLITECNVDEEKITSENIDSERSVCLLHIGFAYLHIFHYRYFWTPYFLLSLWNLDCRIQCRWEKNKSENIDSEWFICVLNIWSGYILIIHYRYFWSSFFLIECKIFIHWMTECYWKR